MIFHFDKNYTYKKCLEDIKNNPDICLKGILSLDSKNAMMKHLVRGKVLLSLLKLVEGLPVSHRAPYYNVLGPFSVQEDASTLRRYVLLKNVLAESYNVSLKSILDADNPEESMWAILNAPMTEWGRLRLLDIVPIVNAMRAPLSSDIKEHPMLRYVAIAAVMYDRHVARLQNDGWHETVIPVGDLFLLSHDLCNLSAGYSNDTNLFGIYFDVCESDKKYAETMTVVPDEANLML